MLVNPLNAKLNPICYFLALLGAHPILYVSRIKVNKRCKKKLNHSDVSRKNVLWTHTSGSQKVTVIW
jgi:hypothetical protein